MEADQDQQVIVERRRATVAPGDIEYRVVLADVALPDRFAVHIERRELSGAEPGVDSLAVGDRAGRGHIAFLMDFGERAFG